jgi:hypothetical protein
MSQTLVTTRIEGGRSMKTALHIILETIVCLATMSAPLVLLYL